MPNIIDYIIDQADRYDNDNIQFEQDIIFNIQRNTDKLISKCVGCVTTDIDTQLKLQQLLMSITNIFTSYTTSNKNLLLDKFKEYENKAYENTGDLIEIGKEVSGRFDESVKELKIEYDEDTVDFIQKHSFELLTGYQNNKITELRSKLGNLLLTGNGTKANVRKLISDVLSTNKSKSEEIAQQELSIAYNNGVMRRMHEYGKISGEDVMKYWHGFKYSDKTCEYCRPRIGNIYDLDDESETLPAHVRCRCVWLPVLKSWNGPVSNKLISKANMLNTGYSMDMIYKRINNRLGIKYAEYLSDNEAIDFISGDRSTKVSKAMEDARNNYISDKIKSFDIDTDTSNGRLSKEYNQQMKFWKNITASAMADNNTDMLNNIPEAIKGIMLLPWTSEQMQGWNKLLSKII